MDHITGVQLAVELIACCGLGVLLACLLLAAFGMEV